MKIWCVNKTWDGEHYIPKMGWVGDAFYITIEDMEMHSPLIYLDEHEHDVSKILIHSPTPVIVQYEFL